MTMQGCCELHQPSAPSGGARRPPRTIAPTLADHGRRQTVRTGRIQIDDVVEGRIKGRSIVGPSPR
jgi:hypothetical protein